MTEERRGLGDRFPVVALGVAVAVVLLGSGSLLTGLALTPVHRSPVEVPDAAEGVLPPGRDVVLLRGEERWGTYRITLQMAGDVDPEGRYTVPVVARTWRSPWDVGDPHIYLLDFRQGVEDNFGVPVRAEGDSLIFRFPLSLLGAGDYIVGLEAFVFGDPEGDSVKEMVRDRLSVGRMLDAGAAPTVLLLAGTVLAGGLLIRVGWRASDA